MSYLTEDQKAALRESMEAEQRDIADAEARRVREEEENLAPHWRVSELALQFPCLANYPDMPGMYPFNGERLLKASRGMSHGQRMAVAFVMSVFNHANPFNVQEALGVWDRHNRAVFVKWAANPWWA